ncbi:MAG: hypothetical protein Q4A62_06450 [Eikenella sp.]|nr:hypothetical protein [Eikenella sp.]
MKYRRQWFACLSLWFALAAQAGEIPCGSAVADMERSFIFVARCAEVMSEAERQEALNVIDAIQQQTDRCVGEGQPIDLTPRPEGMNQALKMIMGNPEPRRRDTVIAECRRQTPMPALRERYRSLMPTP